MRRTQKEARRIVAVWQERLRLDAWEVEIDFSAPAEDDASAAILISDDYLRAVIYLGEGWERAPAAKFERTMVHELVHLLTFGMRSAQKSILYKGLLTRAVEEQFNDRFEHEWECSVETLSVVLVSAFNPA